MALSAPPEWLEEIDQASLSTDNLHLMADDPVIMAATRRANRSNLVHWAMANIEKPGAPVAPHLPPDMLSTARELVRRDATSLMFTAARAAQDAAWQRWMVIAFQLTSDPSELRELLSVSARSIASFIDACMREMTIFMKAEHDQLVRGTHVDRRELVTAILEGAVVSAQQASHRLDYPLNHAHHAAVIWSEQAETEIGVLDEAANTFARCAGSTQPLTVIANAATLWVWTTGDKALDVQALQVALRKLSDVRMTIATAGHGIEGFRRAHLDALATQGVLGRLNSPAQVASFDEIRLVALMARDPEATLQFIKHTLGGLSTAQPSLRRSLRIYLSAGCNATLAAERLHTHRNTLLRRLARAEELLPRPLAQNQIHVAAALEALSWTAAS
ncbi:MAG: polyketide synthase regulator [unclassified Hahellaceae]|nr:polyketide synthase regulator [Hahellaceae bacterium]|tara:strand:+ start:42940 stop:44106 length:1167 start_codon:yes stop_codon:yes gene_type:complete